MPKYLHDLRRKRNYGAYYLYQESVIKKMLQIKLFLVSFPGVFCSILQHRMNDIPFSAVWEPFPKISGQTSIISRSFSVIPVNKSSWHVLGVTSLDSKASNIIIIKSVIWREPELSYIPCSTIPRATKILTSILIRESPDLSIISSVTK